MAPIVARDLMTPEIVAVHDDWTVQEVARYLIDNEISGAVVKDESDEEVGVVSLTDVAAASADNGSHLGIDRSRPSFYMRSPDENLDDSDLARMHFPDGELTVREIMTPTVLAVDADATLSDVAATMLEAHIHRVLVRADGAVVGIISTSDLLNQLVET